MIRAAIFDLDGLLLDSEPHWQDAEIRVFATVGLRLDHALCGLTTGLRIDEVVAFWFARHPWEAPAPEVVVEQVIDEVAALVRTRAVPKPGAAEAVAFARSRGVPVGLASSSPHGLIEAALERLGLQGTFDTTCSALDESHGKPHPAVYLTAADRLGVPATACLAIEDSVPGVIAAKAARMRCLAVPDGAADPRLVLADRVLPSLRGLTEAVWAELVGE